MLICTNTRITVMRQVALLVCAIETFTYMYVDMEGVCVNSPCIIVVVALPFATLQRTAYNDADIDLASQTEAPTI